MVAMGDRPAQKHDYKIADSVVLKYNTNYELSSRTLVSPYYPERCLTIRILLLDCWHISPD